jgi:hypothetical protein
MEYAIIIFIIYTFCNLIKENHKHNFYFKLKNKINQ